MYFYQYEHLGGLMFLSRTAVRAITAFSPISILKCHLRYLGYKDVILPHNQARRLKELFLSIFLYPFQAFNVPAILTLSLLKIYNARYTPM